MAERDRVRGAGHRRGRRIRASTPAFTNPMPNIPRVDAYMWIALTQRGVPFYYRWFSENVAFIRELLPDWAPEFTIPARKTVIVILGEFYGNIPSIIDTTALAKAILDQNGWTTYIVLESTILARGVDRVVDTFTTIRGATGGPLKQPFGLPDVMAQFRRMRETSRRYISTDVRVRDTGPGGDRNRRRRPSRAPGFVVVRGYRRPERERRPGSRYRNAR